MPTLAKRNQPRQKKIPLTKYPLGVERDYRSQLLKLYKSWFSEIVNDLEVLIYPRFDDSQIDSIFESFKVKWSQLVDGFSSKVRSIAGFVKDFTTRNFNRQMESVNKKELEVNPFINNPKLSQSINDFVSENVRLIKNFGNQGADRLTTLINDSVRQGQSIKTIKDHLKTEFGFGENKAKLIARDQVGKFHGNLTQIQHLEAGIDKYIWQTAQDERVRPKHRERNKKVFSWDKPPSDGHPGQPIQCRCVALPYFDDE
ncbi:MAG TPA: minor capsid protein [Thermodesulfobacteriota bacterium]|nr:minor capsid protein [Thermodesulfobacteriota bacterium]